MSELSDEATAGILQAHAERMRKIGEMDLKASANLSALNILLTYKTATSSIKANEKIDSIVEQLIVAGSQLHEGTT